MTVRIIRTAVLLLLGVYTGGVVFVVLAPRVFEIPGTAYVHYWQALNLDYGRAMPVLLLSCVALLIATSVLSVRRGPLVFWLTVAATVLVVATVVLTVTQMESLNRLADSWDPEALPVDWTVTLDAWRQLHLVRVVFAVVAFGCLLVSQVVEVPQTAGTPPLVGSVAR